MYFMILKNMKNNFLIYYNNINDCLSINMNRYRVVILKNKIYFTWILN